MTWKQLPQIPIIETLLAPNADMRKSLYLIAGWTSLGAGMLGILLPLLPTVPFLLLSAFCFSRGSSRLHEWLLEHRWFGSQIKQWEATRTVQREVKIKALLLIVLSFSTTIWLLAPSFTWGIVLVLLAITLFTSVILLPEQRTEKAVEPGPPSP